jgi:hypothetical protein
MLGLFGSISLKDVDAFARSLAHDLSREYPPALDQSGGPRLSEKRLTALLEDVCTRAVTFKNERRLGVHKRARLGNTFRCELEALGYSRTFIDTATEGLVAFLGRRQ